ncbi:MAG: 3-hydroxyacyl-ACP dehydratase FabZ [Holosporales bacterium]
MTKPQGAGDLPTSIGIDKIMELLPHRYPFLLVDRIEDIVPGKSATGVKNVTINEPFFVGHFPNRPIMPGVLIIEAMAQTAGALFCLSNGIAGAEKDLFFMAIDDARFRAPVIPGHTLHIKVEKIQERKMISKFKCQAFVEDKLHTEAVVTAIVMDKPA